MGKNSLIANCEWCLVLWLRHPIQVCNSRRLQIPVHMIIPMSSAEYSYCIIPNSTETLVNLVCELFCYHSVQCEHTKKLNKHAYTHSGFDCSRLLSDSFRCHIDDYSQTRTHNQRYAHIRHNISVLSAGDYTFPNTW